MAFKRKKLIFLLIVIVNDYHLYYCAGVSIIQTNSNENDARRDKFGFFLR